MDPTPPTARTEAVPVTDQQEDTTQSAGSGTRPVAIGDLDGSLEELAPELDSAIEQAAEGLAEAAEEASEATAEAAVGSESVSQAAAAGGAAGVHLPVPVGQATHGSRPSLWRRLTLRGADPTPEPSVSNDVLKGRLDGVALRLESVERAIMRSEERLDERLARLWEVEEQLERLSDLSERTQEARDAAQEASKTVDSLAGNVRVLSLLVGLAIVGGSLAIALPYLLPLQ